MYCFKSRVRYSEVNSETELTLQSLLDYLQDCCIFQSEELGIGLDYLEENHVAWILSSWQIKINRYPRMREEIKVATWPCFFKGFYGHRNFLVEDAEGNTIAQANSVWVFMDTKQMRPARITEHIQEIFRSHIKPQLPGEWADRKLIAWQDREELECRREETVKVARFHIDTNHHMNNGKYILVAEEYLPEGFVVSELRTEYKKAAMLGDTLYPTVVREKNCVTVSLADEEDKPYALIQFWKKA